MDFKNMGAKRVCVVTDSVVKNLNAMKQVIEGLTKEGVEFTVFDGCRIEPKDSSYVSTNESEMVDADRLTVSKRQSISRNLTSQMPSWLLAEDQSLTLPN